MYQPIIIVLYILYLRSDAISDELAGSQLALYAIIAAPLILGTDVSRMPPAHLAMLLNPDVMAISQVSGHVAGMLLS